MADTIDNNTVENTEEQLPPSGGEAKSEVFTQQQVNDIVAKESRKATEKLLSDLGFDGQGKAKEQVQAFKKHLDSQKSDLELAQEAQGKVEKTLQEEKAKNELFEKKFVALSNGIPADKVDKYIGLANTYVNDDIDFDKALALALEDFPVASESKPEPTPKIVVPGNPKVEKPSTTRDAFMEAFKN